MRYQFINENQERYEVGEMCDALCIKASGYYSWRNRVPSVRKVGDVVLKDRIMQIHKQARGRYGHRPIYHHLQEEQIACGRDRTLRLMSEMGVEGVQKKRFKPLGTDSNHLLGYSANLLKELGKPTALDQVWVADTTYLLTDNGWQYLATVMDLFSRRIIGWSVSANNNTELVCKALRAAVMARRELPEGRNFRRRKRHRPWPDGSNRSYGATTCSCRCRYRP